MRKVVTYLLEKAQENGEIQLDNIQTAAKFCVYGQLGILLDTKSSNLPPSLDRYSISQREENSVFV